MATDKYKWSGGHPAYGVERQGCYFDACGVHFVMGLFDTDNLYRKNIYVC